MPGMGEAIAVIPARGGSKRIARKNIRMFAGMPMIARSIATARESGLFSRIIVSTDDPEIADIARQHGGQVPFERPARLADDHASTRDVMQHAADWLGRDGATPEFLCCIYAAAPFIRSEDLDAAARRLSENAEFSMCVPVTEFVFPIQRALRMAENGSVEMMNWDHLETRSQDLETAWHDTGQFYFGRFSHWQSAKPIFGPQTAGLPIEPWRVQDIDTPDDWKRAEVLFDILSRTG